MPSTFFRSSLDLYGRCAMIAWAFAGPTPGSVSSAFWSAVLMLTAANDGTENARPKPSKTAERVVFIIISPNRAENSDRQSVVEGKSWSERVTLIDRRRIKQKQ